VQPAGTSQLEVINNIGRVGILSHFRHALTHGLSVEAALFGMYYDMILIGLCNV